MTLSQKLHIISKILSLTEISFFDLAYYKYSLIRNVIDWCKSMYVHFKMLAKQILVLFRARLRERLISEAATGSVL